MQNEDFAPARVLVIKWIDGRPCLLTGRFKGPAREFYLCPLAVKQESDPFQVSCALTNLAWEEMRKAAFEPTKLDDEFFLEFK